MSNITFNPTKTMLDVEREFGKLFSMFGTPFRKVDSEYENAVWSPLADIAEDKANYFITLDLPGIKPEDVKITVNNGKLQISGERNSESESTEKNYHRVERSYGRYYRSFTLPDSVDVEQINADFHNGQLTITAPKMEKALPKEISITVK